MTPQVKIVQIIIGARGVFCLEDGIMLLPVPVGLPIHVFHQALIQPMLILYLLQNYHHRIISHKIITTLLSLQAVVERQPAVSMPVIVVISVMRVRFFVVYLFVYRRQALFQLL